MADLCWIRRSAMARVCVQYGNRAGRRVRTDRHANSKSLARGRRAPCRPHLPWRGRSDSSPACCRLPSRERRGSARRRHFGSDAFDPCCIRIDRVVEGKGAIKQPARNLSAIGHLAQRCRVNRRGIFVVTVSTADNKATRGVPRPTWVKRSIAFCTMSRFWHRGRGRC